MGDPIFEAAERAVALHYQVPTIKPTPTPCEVDAARELAKTVQELHYKVSRPSNDKDGFRVMADFCAHCLPAYWPCATALKVYSTKQLEEMRK